MKKSLLSAKSKVSSAESTGNGAQSSGLALTFKKSKPVDPEQLEKFYDEIQEKLDLGLSTSAEEQIGQILDTYNLKLQDTATLHSLLSLALEMRGKNADALEAVQRYEDDDLLEDIPEEAAVPVLVQLALAYSNNGDYPKAVAILKIVLEEAQKQSLTDLYGK